jgi:hypothetical protein
LQRKPDNEAPSARFDTEITSSFISEPQQAHNMLPLPSSIPPKTTSFPGAAQGLRWRLWEESCTVKSDSLEGDTAIPIPQTFVQAQQDTISTLPKELNDLRGIGGDKLRLFCTSGTLLTILTKVFAACLGHDISVLCQGGRNESWVPFLKS